MKIDDIDPATINPAQMLKVFEENFRRDISGVVPELLSAGFVAGMAAGISMAVFREKSACLKMLLQCKDISDTNIQLAELGIKP